MIQIWKNFLLIYQVLHSSIKIVRRLTRCTALIVRRRGLNERKKKEIFWTYYPVTMMNQIYKPINFLFESYLYANSTSCNQIDGGDKSVKPTSSFE